MYKDRAKRFAILFVLCVCYLFLNQMTKALANSNVVDNSTSSQVFTVYYHENENSDPLAQTTEVVFGTSTPLYTVEELGLSTSGRSFVGWKAYRSDINYWKVKHADGTESWSRNVPEGGDYSLIGDGWSVARTVPAGTELHLYAQWSDVITFTVYYHESENAAPLPKTTEVVYGTSTPLYTVEELGLSTSDRSLVGWKVYRTDIGFWKVKHADGTESWSRNVPEGGSYSLYGDGWSVAKTVPAGAEVHLYAQWGPPATFTIYYHETDNHRPSKLTTEVLYGTSTPTRTIEELSFYEKERIFVGWKVYRETDNKYCVIGADGKRDWIVISNDQLPNNYDYYLYGSGREVEKTATSGIVHFYAQWAEIEEEMDVTDEKYGANGNDRIEDWQSIQKALDVGRKTDRTITVFIPAGDYYIDRTLVIYSNTNLILDKDARIIRLDENRLMLSNGSMKLEAEGGYKRTENITIQGGIWDGNVQTGSVPGNLFFFAHASNVTIKNTEMKECCGNHFMGFAGVRNITIDNCTFEDFVLYNQMDYAEILSLDTVMGGDLPSDNHNTVSITSEAIQFEYANEIITHPTAIPFDNTACEQMLVQNCSFVNCLSGVGTHHKDVESKDLIIRNNSFYNMLNTCINLYSSKNVTITDNHADNLLRFIMAENTSGEISSNSIINAKEDGIVFRDSESLIVKQNTIESVTGNGISLTNSSGEICSNNINDVGKNGILLRNSESLVICHNNVETAKENGISVVDCNADVLSNTIKNCTLDNIRTTGNCSGLIKANQYDKNGGIWNNGNMQMQSNEYVPGSGSEAYSFTIYYHESENAASLAKTTKVVYGTSTPIYTVEELGFSLSKRSFVGWKAYRTDMNCWRVIDANGVESWSQSVPNGGDYSLIGDGWSVARTAVPGAEVHLYAQWSDVITFTVYYHESENSASLAKTTKVVYGTSTPIYTVEELGFSLSKRSFVGWKAYRSDLKSWKVMDANGVAGWSQSVPNGGDYSLIGDGWSIARTVPADTELHLYAQWSDVTTFTIYYHESENAAPLSKTTKVVFGTLTPICTIKELGIRINNRSFEGWKAYRADIDCWRVIDANGTIGWSQSVPDGGDYSLIRDGWSVARTVPAGTELHLYAQWEGEGEDIYQPGDINGDGKINIFDVIRLLKFVTGEKVETFANTDVNGDGKNNIFDVIRLLKYVTGEKVELY